jgi:S-adenosylmethionine:tRNA ribosyltransferase-isomerase
MRTDDFDFDLPKELIAQHPLEDRSSSKLMVVDIDNENINHDHFYNIINYLNKGDVLVINDTKVMPARLFGIKEATNAHIELLILKLLPNNKIECLVGNAKAVKEGTRVIFGNNDLVATCVEVKDEGIRIFLLKYDGVFLEVLDKLGIMPLPPYIKEKLADKDRYQTVYAKELGSAAAPTAGLHFTSKLLKKIEEKGIIVTHVTLHVGLGTFRPVSVEDTSKHKMHKESYWMNKDTAEVLNTAKKEERKIIAVGTTSVRTLETVYALYGQFKECFGDTDIFIYPGYKFKAVDALITNFHLPKSTLIMLISAFAGKELIMTSYKEAIDNKYRFFSFGDSMFLTKKNSIKYYFFQAVDKVNSLFFF